MNVYDLTTQQLKRAAAIKEQIDRLSKELRSIFGAPANPRAVQKKNQSMKNWAKPGTLLGVKCKDFLTAGRITSVLSEQEKSRRRFL